MNFPQRLTSQLMFCTITIYMQELLNFFPLSLCLYFRFSISLYIKLPQTTFYNNLLLLYQTQHTHRQAHIKISLFNLFFVVAASIMPSQTAQIFFFICAFKFTYGNLNNALFHFTSSSVEITFFLETNSSASIKT